MAIFPGAKGEDILSWRGISDVTGEIRGKIFERISRLLYDESLATLDQFKGRLAEEIASEEDFAGRFAQALAELDRAEYEDEIVPLLARFDRLAEEHFRRRESVVALHTLCNTYRDALVRKALEQVESWLDTEGVGKPPAPYCWLAAGSAGRLEQSLCVDPAWYFIYRDTPGNAAGYFEKFVYRALAFMEKIGLARNDGRATVMKSLWRGSRTEWRREIVEEFVPQDRARLQDLVGRADLRFVHGDEALAEEMINIVWGMLEFMHGKLQGEAMTGGAPPQIRAPFSFPLPVLREMGKTTAETPTGLDFFGRLRLERGGKHRGSFDLEKYALAPLVVNVRMLTINYGLHETNTIARLKRLLDGGHLSVELTERLLRSYHEFVRLKIIRQAAGGCERERSCFIDPLELSADEEQRLRNGLEAVTGLEKIAYLCFAEQG